MIPKAENFAAIIPLPLLPDAWMLGIQTTVRGLSGIEFLPLQREIVPATALAERVAMQLENYFADPGWRFDLPLDLQGSEFQLRVWRRLGEIPAGGPLSYGELAADIGSGARAVGNACRRNPVPLVLPCHRVVAKSGLGGFAGSTRGGFMPIKQALLAHESQH